MPTDQHPSGYIVSDADDLLGLFDADYGVLVIGEGAKILGPNEHGQEILVVAEYLRMKQFKCVGCRVVPEILLMVISLASCRCHKPSRMISQISSSQQDWK